MTVIHIVLIKFASTTSSVQEQTSIVALRTLKSLPSVKDRRLIVGGPSISFPIERSKGFQYALVSHHESPERLKEYQESEEHARVAKEFLYPYKEEIISFDFVVEEVDENSVRVLSGLNADVGL